MKTITKLFAIAILSAIGIVPAACSDSITNQTLRYQVEFRGSDAGELEVIIESADSGYKVRSISHLSLLASMFLKSTTIESIYTIEDDQLLLKSGREIQNESAEEKRSFSVDYAAGKIVFSEGEPFSFAKDMPIDADGFPLWLMFSGADAYTNRKTISVSPKRARQYQYGNPVVESVNVPAGQFDSIKLEGSRMDNPGKTATIWLRKEGEAVPLKIITGEPGKQTTLSLLK